MSSEPAYQYFVGVDWAKDHHDIVVLDAAGQCLGEFTVPHSAAGWRELAERLSPYKNIALCVESGHWLTIEQLLNLPVVLYVVPARSAAAYRLRKAPSGAKSDRFAAWSLAIALRSEHADWTPMQQPDELTHRLRLLCRDQVALIEQRTCLINQLQAALREYYPKNVNGGAKRSSMRLDASIYLPASCHPKSSLRSNGNVMVLSRFRSNRHFHRRF